MPDRSEPSPRAIVGGRSWAVAMIGVLCLIAATQAAGEPDSPTDPAYEQLLAENSADATLIREIEAELAADPEAETSLLAYQDSLSANQELQAQEASFADALEQDPALAERLADYEEQIATEQYAASQIAAYDSLLAADPELANLTQEVERLAAEDPDLLDTHGDAIFELTTDPDEAAVIFSDEEGPSCSGTTLTIAAYVDYLLLHPPLYRAWYRLQRYVLSHPRRAHVVFAHWRWYRPRW